MTVNFHGIPELIKNLQRLEKDMRRKVERPALKKAMRITYNQALATTPIGPTGNLKKGWKLRSRSFRGIPRVELANTAPHSYLVEKGHRLVRGKKKIGSVPPHPFLMPAMVITQDDVLQCLAQELSKGLEQIARAP